MKRYLLSLIVCFASLMVACGNAEVDKINELVVEATELTKAAQSSQEVAEIAAMLQTKMDEITAVAGNKISFGKSVDEALAKYQEAAKAKLAEFGVVLE